MIILAIDPGTKCGWALRSERGEYLSGVWMLKPMAHEGAGMRFLRFRSCLEQMPHVDLVAFEGVVQVHKSKAAAYVYNGLVATLEAWYEERGINYMTIAVSAVKRAALGKGGGKGTGKPEMLQAARKQWPGHDWPIPNESDTHGVYDEADARWIAEAAFKQVGQCAK